MCLPIEGRNETLSQVPPFNDFSYSMQSEVPSIDYPYYDLELRSNKLNIDDGKLLWLVLGSGLV